jgi:hypothetical protein
MSEKHFIVQVEGETREASPAAEKKTAKAVKQLFNEKGWGGANFSSYDKAYHVVATSTDEDGQDIIDALEETLEDVSISRSHYLAVNIALPSAFLTKLQSLNPSDVGFGREEAVINDDGGYRDLTV